MSTVLLAGGSGLIGHRLSFLLEKKGCNVIFLSRKENSDNRFFQWNIEKRTIDSLAIKKADYVINLAGAGIAEKQWTEKRKKFLIESRTQTAALLKDSFEKIKKPKAYLSASAIGFYGNRGNDWLTENAEPQPEDFLSECTIAWENAAKSIAKLNIRTAIFRIGIVLSKNGGALPKMVLPMKFGARIFFGDGKAYYPWIHIDVSKHTKMKILLSTIILLLTLNLFGQSTFDKNTISNKTNKIVKKIEKINELMSSAVYYAGTRPKQWDNFEDLEKTASKEELLELTNYPNGVVRSYSFWALSHKKDIDLFSIVKNHLQDNELINTQFGCIGGQEMVGDFFINVMTPQYVDLNSYKMNSNELTELDSLLIYQPNKLSSRYSAINRAEPTENLYPKIRELVINEKNQSALVTLAKYQKEQDVEIIKNNRDKSDKIESGYYYTYKAISEFPHPKFIPLLETNLKKTLDNTHFSTEWRELYKAIASYKNIKSVELLEIPFSQVEHNNIKKYHIDFVFKAIQQFPDPIYDDLLWRIWEEENQVTVSSYKYLLSRNPSRAYELTKKEILKDYKVKATDFVPITKDIEFSENIQETMLNVIIANDTELSNKIIAEQIENANVHNLLLYTSKVNGQKIFVEPLFKRLEDAWNAHVYLNLVETLISYKDNEINQRILKVRKRNNNLTKDWGGKELDELLLKNNIK